MVKPSSSKRVLSQHDDAAEGPRPKRQNSGELVLALPRSRRLSSEESEYTTDETSDEEEEDVSARSRSASAPGRKSSKAPRRWQPIEDRRLSESVRQHGEANWKAIAARVGSRNHVQCLQRWKKVLRPGLVKGQWSAKEDAVLMELACSGFKNWGVLSNHMPGRTSKQCRERWCHHLDPSINKSAYTPREDKIIIETQARLGNKWSQIAARLPGRTENSIKIRCKALQRKSTGANSAPNSTRSPNMRRGTGATSSRHRAPSSASVDLVDSEPKSEPVEAAAPDVPAPAPVRCSPHVDRVELGPAWASSSSDPSHKFCEKEMPFSPPRSPFFQQNSGGGTPTLATPTSFTSAAGPVRAPTHAQIHTAAGDDGSFNWSRKAWSMTTAPVSRHGGNALSVSAPTWSSSSAATPSAAKREFSNRALMAANYADYSAAAEIEPAVVPSVMASPGVKFEPTQRSLYNAELMGYPISHGREVTPVSRLSSNATGPSHVSCEGAQGLQFLSPYFAYGLNAFVEKAGENVEQGQACSGAPASVRNGLANTGEEASPAAPAATLEETVNAIVKTEEAEVERELVDLSTLALNDLQAVSQQNDDSAAPLRSCCSFLDLPGEDMVLGDMPLSW